MMTLWALSINSGGNVRVPTLSKSPLKSGIETNTVTKRDNAEFRPDDEPEEY